MVTTAMLDAMFRVTYEQAVRDFADGRDTLFHAMKARDNRGDDEFRALARTIRAAHGLEPAPPTPGTYGAVERADIPFWRGGRETRT